MFRAEHRNRRNAIGKSVRRKLFHDSSEASASGSDCGSSSPDRMSAHIRAHLELSSDDDLTTNLSSPSVNSTLSAQSILSFGSRCTNQNFNCFVPARNACGTQPPFKFRQQRSSAAKHVVENSAMQSRSAAGFDKPQFAEILRWVVDEATNSVREAAALYAAFGKMAAPPETKQSERCDEGYWRISFDAKRDGAG